MLRRVECLSTWPIILSQFPMCSLSRRTYPLNPWLANERYSVFGQTIPDAVVDKVGHFNVMTI
jgi:hypothetical protein